MQELSVVIPVFNTNPEYIKIAIDSVLNQTLKNIEIIIVDDGSTDERTLKFLKNLKNSQIKLIKQKNLGAGGARNTGIKYATGRYISFLDSDDWLDCDFYEQLYNACEQNNADIACGTLSIVNSDGSIYNMDKYDSIITDNNLTKIKYITNGSVSSKLFKKSLFDNTCFVEHLYYEDNPVLLKTLINAKIIAYIPHVHYWYRQHESSIVHNKELAQKRSEDIFIVLAEISRIVCNQSRKVRYMAESCFSKILLNIKHYNKNKDYKHRVNELYNKHKRNLLFLVNHMIMGGAEKILCEYIKVLYPYYKITIASRKKITENYFIDFFERKKIQVIDNFNFDKNTSLVQKLVQKIRLKKLFAKQDLIIDFVNCSWYQELRNVSKPKIAWCHGSILYFESGIGINKVRGYDKFVCLTKSFQADFITKYPEYADKIIQYYNPINFEDVINSAEEKINISKPYFIVVNRLDPSDKNTKTVIEAFNLFNKQYKNYKLYIIGDGPQREYLKQIASANKNIIFMLQQNNPYPFIKHAEALILSSIPSLGEGLPTVLIEAQILKTLAISSNVKNGPAEILINGTAGILFEPKNTIELSDVMKDVCAKKIDKTKIIQKATDNLDRFMPNDSINNLFKDMIKHN